MMLVISIISTKGGVGKTTVTANLGGFLADAGLKVLLIDLDIQPTLSSYYKLTSTASCGTYELIALNERNLEKIISKTAIENLDLIFSNDELGQLNTLLLHAPDGRFRLKNLLSIFESDYDAILIDTQGARSVTLEMCIVASNQLISPVIPEVLAAREFRRGTLQLIDDISQFRHLGINLPKIEMLINRVSVISKNAQLIQKTLRSIFQERTDISILDTEIPAIQAYLNSSLLSMPVHRLEYKKPSGRHTLAAIDTIRTLSCELFPQWSDKFKLVAGKTEAQNGKSF